MVTLGVSSVTTARDEAGEPTRAAAPPMREAAFEKDSLRETAALSLTEKADTDGAMAARNNTRKRAMVMVLMIIKSSLDFVSCEHERGYKFGYLRIRQR